MLQTKHLYYVFEDIVIVPEKFRKDGREDVEITIKKQDVGTLYLETGKVVANDPFVLYQTEPFVISVPPGGYTVSIHIAHFDNPVDKRVAFATIRFSDKKVVRWELALVKGERIEELSDGIFFGYGVDSGRGGFMDKSVADKVKSKLKFAENGNDPYDMVFGDMEKQFDINGHYAIGNMTNGTTNDFVAFSSGFGDGTYASYFGFDDTGEPCILVTDFLFSVLGE